MATYMDVILYSRDQIILENAAMKDKPSSAAAGSAEATDAGLSPELSSVGENGEWAWGIVSVKPQTVDYELPMNPITVMRNALGKEEGGRCDDCAHSAALCGCSWLLVSRWLRRC